MSSCDGALSHRCNFVLRHGIDPCGLDQQTDGKRSAEAFGLFVRV